MDYEKEYKEALERAKRLRDSKYQTMNAKRVAEEIFPVLAESEDERMLRTIIRGFENWQSHGNLTFNNTSVDDILAYLEKQKPVQLEEEKEYIRTLKSRIADFLRGKDKDEVDTTYYQRICDWLDGRHVERKPTDEQFPPLEGLDAIKAKYYDDGFKNGFDEGVASVKPAWSKEDEAMLDSIISVVEDWENEQSEEEKEYYGATSKSDWLKSLRPQPHWKPSKEQMDALNALNCHGDLSYVGQQGHLISLYNDIKKL